MPTVTVTNKCCNRTMYSAAATAALFNVTLTEQIPRNYVTQIYTNLVVRLVITEYPFCFDVKLGV
jgi:hypothetical protein